MRKRMPQFSGDWPIWAFKVTRKCATTMSLFVFPN